MQVVYVYPTVYRVSHIYYPPSHPPIWNFQRLKDVKHGVPHVVGVIDYRVITQIGIDGGFVEKNELGRTYKLCNEKLPSSIFAFRNLQKYCLAKTLLTT